MARRTKYDRSAVAEYAAGRTSADVAREFGFPSASSAVNYMWNHGIAWGKRAIGKAYDWGEIALFAPGHTADEVAARFGFPSGSAAYMALTKRGIPFLRKQDGHASGTEDNPVYEWLLDHSSCRMCIDLGWERDCRKSCMSCESFLRQRLLPLMAGT